MKDTLRESLSELLQGGHAHITLKRALEGLKPTSRSVRPATGVHSIWEELEHMRIAQEDILRYTLDPAWQSPRFPEGYWPKETEHVSEEEWATSVTAFLADAEAVVRLIDDESVDLTAEVPHGEGRTYLRQILLITDHNAYHVGQIVQIRKMLGDWNE
jgi:uncharacterized damage-inducible protein DinB